MNKFNQLITTYLVYALTLVIPILIWAGLLLPNNKPTSELSIVIFLWEVLSVHFIFWFIVLIYFFFALLFSSSFRQSILTKLAGIKERDERESIIAGEASKSVFITMLAALIFLFFLSGVSINISKLPPEQIIDGKTKRLSIGFQFGMLDFRGYQDKKNNGTLLTIHDLPLTKEGIIILMIILQIGSYHFFTRKYHSSV